MSALPSSLPGCTRHPDVPSNIILSKVRNSHGTQFTRVCCTACQAVGAVGLNRDHGLPQLNWAPPEILLNSPLYVDSEPTSFGRLLANLRLRSALNEMSAA